MGPRMERSRQVGKQHVRALPEYLDNYLRLITDAFVAYVDLNLGS
jgi:hypothetical protein